jgi:hypothetical protein
LHNRKRDKIKEVHQIVKTIELRVFIEMLRAYSCSIEQLSKASHYKIIAGDGKTVTRFSVLHGKGIKGEPVLEVYVKRALKLLERG